MTDEYTWQDRVRYYWRNCKAWYRREPRNKLITWGVVVIVAGLLVEMIGCVACREAEAHEYKVETVATDRGVEVWAWVKWDEGQQKISILIEPPTDPMPMRVYDAGRIVTVYMDEGVRQWLEARMTGYPIDDRWRDD